MRPKLKNSEKKVRINITLDKSVYQNLKKANVRISTYINQLLRVADNGVSGFAHQNPSNLGGGVLCSKKLVDLKLVIPEYLAWIDAQDYSHNHLDKLRLCALKLSKNTHFFTYEDLLKVKYLFKNDGFYKAGRAICRFLEEKYPDDEYILGEIVKIRKICKCPRSKPDLYTPTEGELKKTLDYLKAEQPQYHQFYLGLLYSGVRIRELWEVSRNPGKYKVLECNGFKKVVLNSVRNTKSAYFLYLPSDYLIPEGVSHTALSAYTTSHKHLLRPKYLRNYFYKKCVELGIPSSIADFYQGRTPVSVGDKHYLEKEHLADEFYKNKLLNSFHNNYSKAFNLQP